MGRDVDVSADLQFQLRTASLVVFGKGELRRAPELIAPWGSRVLLCTGGSSLERAGHLEPLVLQLREHGIFVTRVVTRGEPDVAAVDAAAAICRDAACSSVLAIGGGSVLDVGKAVAALSAQPGAASAIEYLEDVGRGPPRPLVEMPLPMCAVPTTAGSGSEVTRNAVLRVPELGVKRSMRSDLMLPRIALVDPSLLAGAPLKVAAAAGLDALTHLIEGYLSRGAQPTTDLLARRGLEVMWRGLGRLAAENGALKGETASDLALASLWGGIVLTNAGLGAVHGLVAPLGGLCGVAHGDGCACLLPATFRQNFFALTQRAPHSATLHRYAEICALLTGRSAAALEPAVEDAAARLLALRQNLGVPSLAAQGVTVEHFERIVAQSRGGSMRQNPIPLLDEELLSILQASL
jgi:alcohol dehydrogenase class IV